MSLTLYRKYRPQNFDALIGQNHIKITLENEIKSGAIAHAYLFAGPRGIGKTTVARLLAKALNCHERKDGEFEPCEKCLSCVEIKEGKSLDMMEIDAASNTQVDKVRDNIVDNVRFTPYRDKYKVFIIDEVHMLTTSSFNALLKTMEEPPEHCIFILCTTELYKLPETIISRCQHFDFKKVDAKVLFNHLKQIAKAEEFNLDDAVVKNIVTLTGGFVRDSLSMLGQVLSLGKKDITLEDTLPILPHSDFELVGKFVTSLLEKNAKEAVEIINNLVEEGVDLEHFSTELVEYLRWLTLIKLGVKEDGWQIFNEEMYEQAKKIDLNFLLKATNLFMGKINEVKRAEIVQLPLELAAVELCLGEGGEIKKESFSKIQEIKKPVHQSLQGDAGGEKKEEILSGPEEKPPVFKPEEAVLEKKETINGESLAPLGVIKLNLEEIQNRWAEVVAASREFNHSVAVALETAHPLTVLSDGSLEIGFAHVFYCERFKQAKAKEQLEQILDKVFAKKMVVKCNLMSDEKKAEVIRMREQKKEAMAEPLNMILEDFGGVVVE